MSFFFSIRLFLWSAEALWVHFPAQPSKTLSRRRYVPSPHREGPEASVNWESPVPGALLAFCVNQGISASFSPLLSYRRLRTTRFRSVKGPQQLVKPIVLPSLSSSSVFSFLFFASTNIPCLYISPKSTSALLIEEERTFKFFHPFFHLRYCIPLSFILCFEHLGGFF